MKRVYFGGTDPLPPKVRGTDPQITPTALPKQRKGLLNQVLRSGLLHGVQHSMTKIEKTHMAHGVEYRSPFTDKDLVDFASKLPEELKMQAFKEKYIVRRTLLSLLPREVAERPKFPQRMAYDNKLSDLLETLAESYLNPKVVKERGLFDHGEIDGLRRRSVGKPYSSTQAMRLWTAVVTEIWAQIFLDHRGAPINL